MMTNNFGIFSKNSDSAAPGIYTFLSLVIMCALVIAVEKVLEIVLKKLKFNNKRAETVRNLFVSVLSYLAAIIIIIWGLSILGVNIAAIFAGIGIFGMIIGFGAQSLIEDIITGIFIIFEGQFLVGDFVSIDNFRGRVLSIGVRTSRLINAGGNVKIINNSNIREIHNLSEQKSFAVVDASISYQTPLKKAEKVLSETLSKLPSMYPKVFVNTPYYAGVESLGSSSVDLRALAEVDENDIYTARRLMNREIKLAFDENGICIPFPQLVVYDGDKAEEKNSHKEDSNN